MKRTSLITFLAPLLVAGSLNAASDYLLEIDGIKGESSDDRRPGTIEIESFSWGASNTGAASGGGGTGKVSMQDFHFTMKVCKATPKLMLACASGQPIPKATLYVRKSGTAELQEYYVITLEDVLVTSFSQGGHAPSSTATGDDRPTEEVAFYYNKVTIAHTADDGTVTTGEAVRTPVIQ